MDTIEAKRTEYCVTVRMFNSGKEITKRFDSMTSRNIYAISIGPWADVIREWEE